MTNNKSVLSLSELVEGPITDSLVALAQGWTDEANLEYWDKDSDSELGSFIHKDLYHPSTNGGQAFELIEKFQISIDYVYGDYVDGDHAWKALTACGYGNETGSTLTLAICKAVIASKWGDEIPEDVME